MNLNTNIDLKIRILLSIQRTLLGRITPNIRGVGCEWDDKKIIIKYFFDGEISEEDKEEASCAETEVSMDFEDEKEVFVECKKYDFPKTLKDLGLDNWIYARKEIYE